MAKRGPKPPPRQGFHVGSTRVLQALERLPGPRERRDFLRLLWPEMTPRMAELIVEYTREVRRDGARILVPNSWSTAWPLITAPIDAQGSTPAAPAASDEED